MTVEERIQGRRIGVVGMARSGMAAAQLAVKLGGKPFVSDSARGELLLRQTEQLSGDGIPFETDGHSERLLDNDYLVVSPGVPPTIDILKAARDKGIPIFSELEFASWVCRGRIIAITGSNGKTTTTALTGEMFRTGGLGTFVCGNIGAPFSDVADQVNDQSVAVVEVSTFQLEAIADFRPHTALILNLSADHLDRHGTFEEYKKLKYRIAENQLSDDYLILNHEDPTLRVDAIPTKAARRFFTTGAGSTDTLACVQEDSLYGNYTSGLKKILACREIRIRGLHNLQNAAAAAGAAVLFDIPPERLAETLRSFPGVEHRLEMLGRVAGVSFINDSKATNVDSVCWALRAIDTPIYLIAGGRDKGNDYTPLIEYGRDKIKGIVVIGEAGERIFNSLGKEYAIRFADSLEEAVQRCFDMAHPGETVLLSPGCASFDMFDNYEHRGQVFKSAVAGLKNGTQKNQTVRS
ncbi:MAG: UDP-N-acetylmuramoyl-L-alanine--D-glutamate ligase [Candidatus Zixiibacteriota bacterium]